MQRWLFAALQHPVDDAEVHLLAGANFSADEGLAIYQNAYFARLIDVLADTFPSTVKAVGKEAFSALARAYVEHSPPQGPNLNTLGSTFADYLEESCPSDAGDAVYALIDLVRYEWALDATFDGPGFEGQAEVIGEELAALDEAAWLHMRLNAHPALSLLSLSFPVDVYVDRLRGHEEGLTPPPLPQPEQRHLALTRRDYRVRVLVLEADEYALLEALAQGASVMEGLSALSHLDAVTPEALQGWFMRWMREGLFVSLEG